MLDHLSGALESADLADAGDIFAVPLHAKFEILVGIEPLRVDAELSHSLPPYACDLPGHLLDLDDDEFGGLERRKADDDIDDAEIDIVLGGGFLVALHEVSVARRRALKRALAKQVVHERADVQANLRPQRFVVGLKDHPLRAPIETLFDETVRTAAPGLYLYSSAARSAPRIVLAPHTIAPCTGKERKQLIPSGLSGRSHVIHYSPAIPARRSAPLETCRCFPHTAGRVGSRHNAGHNAARYKSVELIVIQWIGLLDAGKIERGIARCIAAEIVALTSTVGLVDCRSIGNVHWVGHRQSALHASRQYEWR